MISKGKSFPSGLALLALAICLTSSVTPAHLIHAQSGDTQTVISPHKTYQFEVPPGWVATISDNHDVTLTNGTTEFFFLDSYYFFGSDATPPWNSPARLLTELISDELNANAELTVIEINGQAFARMDTFSEEYGPYVFLATIFENGDPLEIVASLLDPGTLTAIPDADIAVLLDVATSLRSITEPIPDTLQSYDDGWQVIVEELIDKGLVPTSGGQLLFDIPDAYVDGTGLFARMLSEVDASVRNLILGADIDFQVPGDLDRPGSCILEARVDLETDDRGYQSGYVAFYLRSNEKLYIRSRQYAGPNTSVYVDYSKFSGTQINLVAYLIADRLTTYVNGQLVGHNILIPDQAGPFMIALDVQGENVQCDMHVWAYELP